MVLPERQQTDTYELFRRLGESIEAEWNSVDYDESRFPQIAADALQKADIPAKVSAWDVVKWVFEQNELPRQKDVHARFADPPVTLWVGPRFYVDVYFWLEGTTATHQHSFCGAFQVFMGSSIHSWYEFEARDKINVFAEIGEMSLRTCELLEVGAVQEIRPGRQYIHSLFHLDQPSATIVVRTDRSPLEMPQYSYHKPSFAIDPFYEHDTTTKKTQFIGALFRSKHPDTDKCILDTLAKSDFQTSFMILTTAIHWLRSDQLGQLFNAGAADSRLGAMLDVVRQRHGARADVFRQVFEHQDRETEIIKRRRFVTNSEHRYFFALVLNVEGKDRIFSLIKQRFPGSDPLEKILDWTLELSETRVLGMNETNALGIPDFDNLDMLVLEGLLKDKTESELRAEIENEHQNEAGAKLLEQLADRIAKLRNSPVFNPLFS